MYTCISSSSLHWIWYFIQMADILQLIFQLVIPGNRLHGQYLIVIKFFLSSLHIYYWREIQMHVLPTTILQAGQLLVQIEFEISYILMWHNFLVIYAECWLKIGVVLGKFYLLLISCLSACLFFLSICPN